MRDALGGGVGAVRGAECVVDVDVGEGGELPGEAGIVGFFFGVEAEVLEQEDLARLELARHFFGDLAYAVGREGDVDAFSEFLVEELAEAVDDRAHGVFRIGLALGAAEVRGEDDFGGMAERVDDGGKSGDDARVVGDGLAVFGEGHVEVYADEDALVGQVDVADGELGHKTSVVSD